MNKIKVAKELIKLAKSLVANQSINLIMDKDGHVKQVSDSLFNNLFNAKVAAKEDYFKSNKAIIYVSPVVNATHPTVRGWNKDLIQKTKNWFATLKNKLNHQKMIFDTLSQSQETEDMENRGFSLGCSIVKQKGLFPTDNGRYTEDSYAITVFGASRREIDKFAETLRKMFDQQSVIVEFGTVSERYIAE